MYVIHYLYGLYMYMLFIILSFKLSLHLELYFSIQNYNEHQREFLDQYKYVEGMHEVNL